jgi:MFS family permease
VRLAQRLGPLTSRSFLLLWLGRTTSAVGDALVPVALAFAIVDDLGAGAGALGIVFAVSSVARVVFTLVGGVWADRLPRRAVMLTCDAIRALIEAAVFALLLAGAMEVWMFAVSGAIFGAASAFFGPASTGLVAETAPRATLQEANALLSMSQTAATVVGPAAAGILVATVGAAWVFALDSVTFVASGLFLAALRLAPHVASPRKRFLADLHDGWREVTGRTWLWVPYISFAFSNLVNAVFFVLGPVVFATDLGGAGDWGLALSLGGVGGFAGSLVALRWRPKRPLAAAFLVWSTGALPPLTLIGPSDPVVVGTAVGLYFAGIVIGGAFWNATMQERIPLDKLSRVDSYDWLISLVFQPLGFALAGAIATGIGIRTTLLIAAALSAFVHLAVLALPSLREITRAEPQLETAKHDH